MSFFYLLHKLHKELQILASTTMTISDFFLSLTQAAKYAGAALGAEIGIVFPDLPLATSRSSQKEQRLVQLTFLDFALCEAMGLLAIMMAFLILYVSFLIQI